MKQKLMCLIGIVISLAFVGCTVQPPTEYKEKKEKVTIYPDYTNTTIPYNIAPLNFNYEIEGEDFITELCGKEESIVVNGKNVRWNMKQWKRFLDANKGGTVAVKTYVKEKGEWMLYTPFRWMVAEEPIDPYISYRLISPSYVTYEELTINQRHLENFDESVIYNNMLLSEDGKGQCINCHSYKNYKTDNMQFHARQHLGGTVLVSNGEVKKINLKTDSTIAPGVYPAWHPTHNLIAYSINQTGQSFHTKDNEKVEVQDIVSDLILYDVDHNQVRIIENDTAEWEVFPAWAPDGKTLYYVSSKFEVRDPKMKEREMVERYKDFKYDMYRKSFDPNTLEFGPKEKILAASDMNKSVTFPRVSPDGRYLLYTMGDFGYFHIWHKSADLYLMDLKTGESRNMREINSNDVESYHAWSSNGRWILFSSRRDDGGYTRLYVSYFDKRGRARKPFIIPQKNPEYNMNFYKSYNIPEFMIEPVRISPQEFARNLKKDAVNAEFVSTAVSDK